jgi:hypothetical protein
MRETRCDHGWCIAGEHRNEALTRSLEAARAPMAVCLVSMGIRLPDRKAKRGRWKKGSPAAGRGNRSNAPAGDQ